jgi:hypothetical protein
MHCSMYLLDFWYGHTYIVVATTEPVYGDASSQNGSEDV